MSDFRFASPDWSAALWGVVAIVCALIWLEQRRGRAIARFLSITMGQRLVVKTSALRRFSSIVLIAAAAVCFVVALMRPQYGLTYVKSPRVGAQIMFCLDVSKSMLAEDVAPNRLERAKADINDLLTFLEGDQVGLTGFAGRAAVMCPLTPDYGFFKLILDEAGPSSVGRGGTRLEEPLRKALDGFRSESDVSRIVFLITDGEDQDSHPLDVAEDAIERGVKVVAVGIGDESGSEIRITNPRTGVQQPMLDADGKPVITRLDGETLRKLALATEGVYIPAGTGSLDLKSIYDVHIKPLVRGQMQTQGRAIRRDAFQWFILAGLVCLMAGLALGSRRVGAIDEDWNWPFNQAVSKGLLWLTLVWLADALPALAQDPSESSSGQSTTQQRQDLDRPTVDEFTAESSTADKDTAGKSTADGLAADEEPTDPRELYNQGLASLAEDSEKAERLLTLARRESGRDGEVRFRATYNMGWVEVNRANEMIQDQPEQALVHLERAAGWFRDAVRLRSDADDARHNLEVVLLRIVQLRDQLSKQNERDLAGELDALIETQRKTIGELRVLVQQVAARDDPNVAEELRAPFQKLSVDQRVMLSDLQGLVERAAGELESLEAKSEEERTAEENVRIAQLLGVMNYLNQASQRIGQARSQLRRRQASRGFRRSAMGLSQLKRARDQLRDPLQILDSIIGDLATTTQQTALKSLDRQVLGEANDTPPIPNWIDQDFLSDSQSDLADRTKEITERLQAGLQAGADADGPEASDPLPEDQQAFWDKLAAAMPHLVLANNSMGEAKQAIELAEYAEAYRSQIEASDALQLAREQFADLRTLIDLAYQTQNEISNVTGGAVLELTASEEVAKENAAKEDEESESDSAEQATADAEADKEGDTPEAVERSEMLKEVVAYSVERQAANLERMDRLQREIERELERVRSASAASDDAEEKADGKSEATEQQRFELALELASRAATQMRAVQGSLSDVDSSGDAAESDAVKDESGSSPLHSAESNSADAIKTLEELRRLFFTIVEHLRETAQKQAELNDDTETSLGMNASSADGDSNDADSDQSASEVAKSEVGSEDGTDEAADEATEKAAGRVNRLASEQLTLAETAGQIASVLQQQSELTEANTEDDTNVDPQQQQLVQQNAEKARKASDLVFEAKESMTSAADKLAGDRDKVDEIRSDQNEALQKLIEALRELQPPQEDQSDQDQQNQPSDSQQNQEQDQEQNQNQQQEPRPQDSQMDPSRVLQVVRDREAQRRRDKERQQQRAGQIPVEKDW